MTSPRTDQAQLPPPSSQPEPEITSSALAKPPLTIAAVGDLMLGTDFPTDRLASDDGAGQLAQASTYLAAADVAFGNLEGALLDGGKPVKVCKDPSLCYLFRSPVRYAGHLRDAGEECLGAAHDLEHQRRVPPVVVVLEVRHVAVQRDGDAVASRTEVERGNAAIETDIRADRSVPAGIDVVSLVDAYGEQAAFTEPKRLIESAAANWLVARR